MAGSRMTLPVDSRGQVITGAMGLPIVAQKTLVDDTNFAEIFDLSLAKYATRVFTGIAIRNLSAASTIELSFGGEDANDISIICGTSEFMVLDDLCFGPAVIDESEGTKVTSVRARLGTTSGTQASGTIDYSGAPDIIPNNEETVEINGLIYEFSNDTSKETTSDVLVAIGVSADATWTNLVNAINANDYDVRASIVTATNIITITAVVGGADGDAITIADGANPTGAAFSGATLSGSAGGITPVIHIW